MRVRLDLAVTDRDRMRATLQSDEGLRLFPYQDTRGTWTIGYGRNLTAVGISVAEATVLFDHDLARVEGGIAAAYPWSMTWPGPRYAVLVNMAYNLGLAGLARFARMLAAAQAGDYDTAAQEMVQSNWAIQVGPRAARLSRQMQRGTWA